MSVNNLKRFCITIFLFFTIACNSNNGNSNSLKTPMNDTLKIEGCQDNIKTKPGSILEIRLEAVPGSGYQWLLKDSSQLLQQLHPDSLEFTNPVTNEPAPGVPVQQVLHFKVMKKGTEVMRLEYKRIWEKETLKSCEIKIGID